MVDLRGTNFEGVMPSEMETTAQYGMQPQPQGIMAQLMANPNIPMTPAWQDQRLKDIKSGGIRNEMLMQLLTAGSFLGGKPMMPNVKPQINPASQFGMQPGSKTGVINQAFKRPANTNTESSIPKPPNIIKDAPEVSSTDLTRSMTPAQEAAEEMAGTFTPKIYQDSPDMKKIMGEVSKNVSDASKTPTFQSKAQKEELSKFASDLKTKVDKRTNEIINKYVSATKENPNYAKSVMSSNARSMKSASNPTKPLSKYADKLLEFEASNANIPRDAQRKSLENDLTVLKYNQDKGNVKGDMNKFENARKQQEIKRLLDLLNSEK